MGSFLYFPCSLPELWSLKCLKKCIFAVLCWPQSLLKQFTQYIHLKGLVRRFQKMIVYYAMTHCFGDIRVWSQIILLKFCWVSIFFCISIVNIAWTVAHTPKEHIIFWKGVMRTFRCIYVNCFDSLRFLATQNYKKWHFFE